MAKGKTTESETIWGGPTKRFFVAMLTRDISLVDAILDLVARVTRIEGTVSSA